MCTASSHINRDLLPKEGYGFKAAFDLDTHWQLIRPLLND